jgi:hypothetical protein
MSDEAFRTEINEIQEDRKSGRDATVNVINLNLGQELVQASDCVRCE